VLGAVSLAGQATVALGLPLGGLLVGAAGWRIVFP
jgi:predicted MFS family arabinose efflux permease